MSNFRLSCCRRITGTWIWQGKCSELITDSGISAKKNWKILEFVLSIRKNTGNWGIIILRIGKPGFPGRVLKKFSGL